MNLKLKSRPPLKLRLAVLGAPVLIFLSSATGTERFFTYTYEPETLPKGAFEYEQWITSRLGRTEAVGQENYNRWEFRHELEYGVTDNYSLSLYLNHSLTDFHDTATGTGRNVSHYQFDNISLENRLLVVNPVDHPIGIALYLEPAIWEHAAELEGKLILGQRIGSDWKWALNLTHATEWTDDFHSHEGEVELGLGLTRMLNSHWSLGLEARDHNELPDYRIWENTAFYLGPVVTYTAERWWATFTVMPQIVGANFSENVDQNHHLELEGHERLNLRLIVGITF